MKKISFLFLLILLVFCFYLFYSYNFNKKSDDLIKEDLSFNKAIFVSYLDYSPYLKNKDIDTQKDNLDKMISNINEYGFNMVLLQVRPFCDAIYKSRYFSPSLTVVSSIHDELNFDILDYFIKKCHKYNIKVHAWINPYRVRSSDNIKTIREDSKIYSWLNTNRVYISSFGIYLNPANDDVLEYILNGVKEIVSNYDIDGILYDDYFYPNREIDLENYDDYKKSGGILDIDDYRRENINNLIKETYNTIKSIKKDVLFGLSPAGNIENNYNNEYLDIKYLLNENLYLDYVMPQLYYGFENQIKPFIETLDIWNLMIKSHDVKLYPALALYKSGKEDKYALKGKEEWILNDDIIKKQVIVSHNKSHYGGFSIFRYDFIFNGNLQNEVMQREINNLKIFMQK